MKSLINENDNIPFLENLKHRYSFKITEFIIPKINIDFGKIAFDFILLENTDNLINQYIIINDVWMNKRTKYLVKFKQNPQIYDTNNLIEVFAKFHDESILPIEEIKRKIELYFEELTQEFHNI